MGDHKSHQNSRIQDHCKFKLVNSLGGILQCRDIPHWRNHLQRVCIIKRSNLSVENTNLKRCEETCFISQWTRRLSIPSYVKCRSWPPTRTTGRFDDCGKNSRRSSKPICRMPMIRLSIPGAISSSNHNYLTCRVTEKPRGSVGRFEFLKGQSLRKKDHQLNKKRAQNSNRNPIEIGVLHLKDDTSDIGEESENATSEGMMDDIDGVLFQLPQDHLQQMQ